MILSKMCPCLSFPFFPFPLFPSYTMGSPSLVFLIGVDISFSESIP